MTKEEDLKEVKENWIWFLNKYPEWNNGKEVVIVAIQDNCCALEDASK